MVSHVTHHACIRHRYLRNITIPAAFVTKSTGDALKELVAKKPTGQEEVIVVMDWLDALPRADKVEWEFWTNSNDQCGAVCDVQKEFIKVSLGLLWLCLAALLVIFQRKIKTSQQAQ